ncbi:hypothetical protein HY623_01095 [Candidatus Uhrbacteria bacterium]|nr:hypothetical protein [Candidatus Uhrbacteria bacterium]
MNASLYMRISATLFLIIFVFHLLRVIYGWEAAIAGWSVPMWLSWVAVLVSGFLSAYGFRLGYQKT